jgi:alpha-tubulin suppressor-like RCC1 family protein
LKPRTILVGFSVCLALGLSFGCGTAPNAPEQNVVAAPSLTPVAGTYSAPLDVAMSTTTAEAAIRYTTDGSTPTPTSGTVYTAPVHVGTTTTFQAVAYRSGWTTSPVTTAAYTIAPLVAAPSFSPGPGIYLAAQDVAISTSTTGASIRYTTDGTTPTADIGTLYAGPVTVATTLTLKAVAFETGHTTSLVTTGLYEIGPLAASPSFEPPPGTYLDSQDIIISTTTAGASIRYTTDGTTPSSTAGTLYAGPVHLVDSVTLRAVAFGFGIRTSAVTSGVYTIGLHVAAPEFSPLPGNYASAQDIIISTSTAGASIRYTTDGTTPTDTVGTPYTGAVHLAESLTLKAVGYESGWITSPVTSGEYKIGEIVADPAFSVTPGTYGTAKDVAISTTTQDAAIRYTTDGSTPTASHGTVYASPVRVDRTLTLKAVAYRTGWTTSGVTTGEYKRVGLAAGIYHSLLAKSDGTVWSWGGNFEGQIGDGTTNSAPTPARVTGLAGVIAVAAGYYHSLALKSDGTVWAWGRNLTGQLGDGTTTQRLGPVQTQGISSVAAVAGGGNHTYALKSDGTVWAWGSNSDGQLGDATTTDRYLPVQVQGLTSIVAIAAGERHGVALEADGTVWAWGSNAYGNLGDGTTTMHLVPFQVPSLSTITAIAANGFHTSAVPGDGTLWSWGSGSFGELGNNDQPMLWPVPIQAVGLTGVAAAAAGTYHTIAILANGNLKAFGFGLFGQLGDGTNANRSIAVAVQGISSAVAIAASYDHTLAVLADETVWAWGHNLTYQLGDGTTTDRWTPVRIIP